MWSTRVKLKVCKSTKLDYEELHNLSFATNLSQKLGYPFVNKKIPLKFTPMTTCKNINELIFNGLCRFIKNSLS